MNPSRLQRLFLGAVVMISIAPLVIAAPAFFNEYRHFAARYLDRGAFSAPRVVLSAEEAATWLPVRSYHDAIPVLLYHGINRGHDTYSVSRAAFAEQMLMLHESGFNTISIAQYAGFLRGDVRGLPPRPILLTFDDGRLDTYRGADAVLARYGFRATIFVIAGDTADPFYLTWDELRTMAESGRWDVQEHAGYGHYLIPYAPEAMGSFYAYRTYSNGVLESWSHYQARVTSDVLWGERQMSEHLPDYRPYAFAVPFGNFGQVGTNDNRIPSFLNGWLTTHFDAVFPAGTPSYTRPTDPHGDLIRFEVQTSTSADALYSWLASHAPDPRLAWIGSTAGAIFSSPAVAGGRVFVGSEDGRIYAFDARTGATIWAARTSGSIFSSPTVARGTVYVGSFDGRLYAFGATTGLQMWASRVGVAIQSSPAVSRGTVYVGSQDGTFSAFDARTGSKIWRVATGGGIVSSPSVTRIAVYVGSEDGNLYALRPKTGARIWTAHTANIIDSSPAVSRGRVYVGSEDRRLYAFDARTGQTVWTARTGGPVFSSPFVILGTVYIGSDDHRLYAFDAVTGALRWMASTRGPIKSSPVVQSGVVYVGSDDDGLYAFRASGCRRRSCPPIWSGRLGDHVDSSPTVGFGDVFVGSGDGGLYAFRVLT